MTNNLPLPTDAFDGLPEPSEEFIACYSISTVLSDLVPPSTGGNVTHGRASPPGGGIIHGGSFSGRGPGTPPPAASAAVTISDEEQAAIKKRINEVVDRRFLKVSENTSVIYRGF